MRFARTLAVAAAMAGLSASTAAAATVETGDYGPIIGINYDAAPGEVNDVTMSLTGRDLTIDDRGAAAVTSTSDLCRAGARANVIICTVPDDIDLKMELGDGDDTAVIDASVSNVRVTRNFFSNVFVYGGAGNDRLTGKAAARGLYTGLYGGDGADVLRGSKGSDVISGDAGNDWLMGDYGADRLSGGAGIDTVSYQDGRTSGVSVVVAPAPATGDQPRSGGPEDVAFGEFGDKVSDAEAVLGTTGDDYIMGDASNNTLSGSGGKDELYGLDGNDTLSAPGGPSILEGGSGNDRLLARNGQKDSVLDCGEGTGDNATLDLLDTDWIGCEFATRS